MWNNWSGRKKFWLLKVLQASSAFVGVIVAIALFFIPFPELWMRMAFAFVMGLIALFAVHIFVHWLAPNCPHCGAKLTTLTRWQTYKCCPHCGEKFDEPM